MKQLLCKLIASAPPRDISGRDGEWDRASRLAEEARTSYSLIYVLLMQYNSAIEPQATIYHRIERVYEKAVRRKQRRAVAESVAMYRSINRTPDADHVFYAEIVAALQMEAV